MRVRSILVLLAILAAAPVAAGQVNDVDRFQAAIGLARVKRDAGDVTSARKHFEEARRIRQFDARELAEYFWVLAGQDAPAALAIGREILAKNPEKHDVRDRTITEALTVGDEDAIGQLARAGHAVEQRTALWPRRLAESLSRQKRHGEAADAYRDAVGLPDASDQDRVGLAFSLEAAGRYGEAVDAWAAVPASTRQSRPDFEHSRLRALALSSNPSAGAELGSWLQAAPADADMRALAVDVWMRRGEPERALAIMGPLTGEEWTRRRALIARAAGRRDAAIAALDALGPRRRSREDNFTLAELLIDERAFGRASTTLSSLAQPNTCESRLINLVDRIPDDPGTRMLVGLLSSPACNGQGDLLKRGIARTVASSQHATALTLIKKLPATAVSAGDMRRLTGLLLLWTGDPRTATPLLEQALAANGRDLEVRQALVDAYRLERRQAAAWSAAEPLLSIEPLSPERRLILAELALDSNHPAEVSRLLREDAGDAPTRARLRARAALARLEVAERDYLAAPSASALANVLDLQKACGDNATAALIAGRILAKAGHIEQALAMLPSDGNEDMAEELRRLRSTLWVRLATTAWAAGAHDKAADAARQAVANDPRAVEAWFILVDHAAETNAGETLHDVSRRFVTAIGDDATLVVGMAERMSAFVRSSDDPIVSEAIALLSRVSSTDPRAAAAVNVARARIYSAAERWPESIEAVDAAVASAPASPVALKLRAEILSWSGRHADALEAYDAYFKVEPTDIEARRQQARVAGWSGNFAVARALYTALRTQAPNNATIAAEMAAKVAYFEGRWTAAVASYRTWLSLEPRNGEARFELAESLRAAGLERDADAALSSLASTDRHRLAQAALEQARLGRRSRVTLVADERQTDGYGGQRLLDARQYGAAWTTPVDSGGRASLTFTGAAASASDGVRTRRGYDASLSATGYFTPAVGVSARAAVSTVGVSDRATVQGGLNATWRTNDRWTMSAGADRSRVAENVGTIDARLVATGVQAGTHFENPSATLDLQVGRHGLSDGNARTRATVTFTRVLSDRMDHIRIIGWAESLSYRFVAPGYYSPSRMVRADAGVQFTQSFFTPRFRNDRQQFIQISYLAGADDRGTIYHHPAIGAVWQFSSGLAFDAHASWIRSSVYSETSIYAGITTRPGSRRR